MVKVIVDASCLGKLDGGGTSYDDTEVINRIKALEGKTDNFVKEVTVSREGNKVKFTYTRVDGTSSEVEFDDKDTISIAYDDTALKERVIALEEKVDKDTIYDDTALKARVTALENKEDKDSQTLSLNGNELSISNGNSVTLPEASSSSKTYEVTSDTEGVVVTKTEDTDTVTHNVNLDEALNKFYKKAETYTKTEVDNLLNKQEEKATDITLYKGTFTDKSKVREGDFEGPNAPRVTLTYSSSTGVGILKLDMKVMSNVAKSDIVAKLPDDAPAPVTLIESQVWVGNAFTSVWVDPNAKVIRMSATTDSSIFNKRLIINIPGIFKK